MFYHKRFNLKEAPLLTGSSQFSHFLHRFICVTLGQLPHINDRYGHGHGHGHGGGDFGQCRPLGNIANVPLRDLHWLSFSQLLNIINMANLGSSMNLHRSHGSFTATTNNKAIEVLVYLSYFYVFV